MTEGHKHRLVPITVDTRFGGALIACLRKPRFHTTNVAQVEASPYPYGRCRAMPECYYLSLISILHRWTGFTVLVQYKYGSKK